MTFWQHFLRVLYRRPVPALAALYWYLTRRRVRAIGRLRIASADLPFAYQFWIETNERLSQFASDTEIGSGDGPKFAVVVYATGTASGGGLQRSLGSLSEQIYTHWTYYLAETESFAALPDFAEADWIVPLRAGDRLSKGALLRLATAAQFHSDASILYGDQDQIDRKGQRHNPWFKPQWNEELFLAIDYLSSSLALEAGLVLRTASEGSDQLTSLIIAATDQAPSIVHVPHILVHTERDPKPDPSRVQLVARQLKNRKAICTQGEYGTVKVEWPLPEELPLVTIIIPTKDKVDLLQRCIESIFANTDYPNFDLLIVDNCSSEKRTADFLRQIAENPKVCVLNDNRPFNYSRINNFAARMARGSFLCLLNNDTEVLKPAWLTELMRYAARPEIGAAGGKLLYEDGSIQHAGVVVGIGEAAGHPHRFLPAGQPGYFWMPHVAQYVSAVTGACLVVEKAKFFSVEGFDEKNLAVAFNDVDLCLRLQCAGWRNVYVPHAVLLHHESKSRGSDMESDQFERYCRELKILQERWGTKTYADPLHNPNLDRYSETYLFRI